MEDSSLDWDECEDDGEVEKESGFSWVLSKGLNLGKNLAITGVVVSSVPIVVPPLLVVSALGFAFSVPFGFMYASYTCTEKLMSKLLPNPSPHMIEYCEGEFVGSEEKGSQIDYDEIGGFGEGMMINYQEEMSGENDGVILVDDSEEGLTIVREFGADGEDEEGLQYNDIIRSEEGLSAVNEFGKDDDGLQFDNKTRSEEGLSAVTEFGKDEDGVQYEDQTRGKEGLSTVGELKKDEGLQKDDVNMSEEGLSTGTESGKEKGLQKNNVNRSEEGLSAGAEFGKEEDRPWKKDVNMNEEAPSTGTRFGKDGDGLEEFDMNRGETDPNRASGVIMVADELDVPYKEDMRYGGIDNRERLVEEIGAEVNRSGIEESRENNVNMSEEALSTGTEFGKDEEGLLKKDVSMSEEALSTGTEFGKGGDGLEEDDMNRGETNVNRASGVIMVVDELDVPYKVDMQYGGTDDRGRPVEDMGVEVNRSGVEESRETQATDDAMSQVQTIPPVETKAYDDAISQAQTVPSVVETSDNKNIREVTHHDVEAKIDTKLRGEKNETHGLKGMDKGKKRHTYAKGKKKTQKTQKRVEGDVSKAHEKDVVKPETVSGKADTPLESENKLNLDKNETQLPAPDVADEMIKGVVIISKENDEPGNLRASIGDIDENNKNAVLPESEFTANEPRDQAVSVLIPVLEVSDLKSVPVIVQHEELPELKDDSAQVEGNGLLKNKEMIGDEEIWRQIDSIRTIVGFKVARHTSYFEELKALYVFTGIEPPSLFSDPLDTSEVCDKLRFLMSVIGVK